MLNEWSPEGTPFVLPEVIHKNHAHLLQQEYCWTSLISGALSQSSFRICFLCDLIQGQRYLFRIKG